MAQTTSVHTKNKKTALAQHRRIKVGIIGAGPAGLTLSLLLQRADIENIIIENRSREHIESRVRAGLLEQNTVDLFNELGVAERLNKEGLTHHGVYLSFNGVRQRVPFQELTGGRCITIYGQQEVVKDLIAARLAQGGEIHFETEATDISDIDTAHPKIEYTQNGQKHTIDCDFVIGCDGYHGLSRKKMPKNSFNEFRIDYPFSWLGILANVAPSSDELIYAYHEDGFALLSLRSEKVSRLYIQVDNDDKLENWSDEKIWDALEKRLSDSEKKWTLKRGDIFEKSITPMRSFMIDNMQYGRLFLTGDAAHIVPPTGGKGLNLAVADARILAEGLIEYYTSYQDERSPALTEKLKNYSADCLRRVWRVQDFSNFMTYLFHKQAAHGSFENLLQKSRFDYIHLSKAQATTIAENYVGLKEI